MLRDFTRDDEPLDPIHESVDDQSDVWALSAPRLVRAGRSSTPVSSTMRVAITPIRPWRSAVPTATFGVALPFGIETALGGPAVAVSRPLADAR
ncbi:hypothetical protein [Streptomyces chartreusis]|uniref:hypothetical protein n=1 Tax=Streptomyces chartreusis TaxID=1969 RepID=UPI003675607A